MGQALNALSLRAAEAAQLLGVAPDAELPAALDEAQTRALVAAFKPRLGSVELSRRASSGAGAGSGGGKASKASEPAEQG